MRWWHSVLMVGWFLTQDTQAYAPIMWMQTPTSGRALMPKDFKGWSSVNMVPPQQLVIGSPEKTSPSSFPYFTAKADNSISWDDMGWCVEASGRASGDAVRVNQCSGAAVQKWSWIPDVHGRYMIQLKDTNRCLDVKQGGLHEGSIELRDCASQMTDLWKFEESLPRPTSAPAASSVIRQALVSLLSIVGVGMLGLTAWMWRPQRKACAVAVGRGGLSMSILAGGDLEANIGPVANLRRSGNVSMMAGEGAHVDWSKKIEDGIVDAKKTIGQNFSSTEMDLAFPPETVNIYERVKDKGLILVGLPGAITPNCSSTSVTGYLEKQDEPKAKTIDELSISCLVPVLSGTFATRARPVLMQQQEREQGVLGGFRLPFGQKEVPVDQQPVIELQNLRRQPFYDWADDDDKYKDRLIRLYQLTSLFISFPIAYVTFDQLPYELPQLFLSANIGTFTAMAVFVFRLRVGYDYVAGRLKERGTYYEANQRGLFANKDREMIARDKLIFKTQVKPCLNRIDVSLLALALGVALSVGGGEIITRIEGEDGPSTLKTFIGKDAIANQYRLKTDNNYAEDQQRRALRKMKADGTGVQPVYCDSRYYKILAGGNAQGGVGCGGSS